MSAEELCINCKIKDMRECDREEVLSMMRIFYASPAVISNGSEEIFLKDIDACVSDDPYLEGYVFERDGKTVGYSMLAKSFSTEFGKHCIWIEDLYLKPEYRGEGIGSAFFRYVSEKYPHHLLRLEAEEENAGAIRMYERAGFDILPYVEMKK